MTREELNVLLQEPTYIDETGEGFQRYEAVFEDLQSNIVSSHGKKGAHYLFIRFHAGAEARIRARYLIGMLARNALERAMVFWSLTNDEARKLVDRQVLDAIAPDASKGAPFLVTDVQYRTIEHLKVTSEREVRADRNQQKSANRDSKIPVSLNFFLTASGYKKLDLPAPSDKSFREGMRARRAALGDPPSAAWEPSWQAAFDEGGVDALLTIDFDDEPMAAVETFVEIINKYASMVKREKGAALRAAGHAIEPFGFRDNISQPLFYLGDVERQTKAQGISQETAWSAVAPLGLAICPDPNGRRAHACGSYLVFRKLRQDVAGFYRQVKEISAKTRRTEEEVLADVIGRKRNGDPLVTSNGLNDFDYSDDGFGRACPFHSHIRKSNPRSDIAPAYNPRRHRIVRRGIPYGSSIPRDDTGRPIEPAAAPKDLGLLFMCAQSSIVDGFEHIQTAWAGNPGYPSVGPGVDPIIGDATSNGKLALAFRHNDEEGKPLYKGRNTEWSSVVTLQGGEYFFAPSISFLKGLVDDLWTRTA